MAPLPRVSRSAVVSCHYYEFCPRLGQRQTDKCPPFLNRIDTAPPCALVLLLYSYLLLVAPTSASASAFFRGRGLRFAYVGGGGEIGRFSFNDA
jgi:hypothetical protein